MYRVKKIYWTASDICELLHIDKVAFERVVRNVVLLRLANLPVAGRKRRYTADHVDMVNIVVNQMEGKSWDEINQFLNSKYNRNGRRKTACVSQA